MRSKIGSNAWHKEMERRANNPKEAWTKDWGFEFKVMRKALTIFVCGLLLAHFMYPMKITDALALTGMLLFVCSGFIVARRNAMYTNNKNLTCSKGYMWYREWQKTQSRNKDVDRINDEIFKEQK